MTRFGWLVVSGIVFALLAIALLLWGFARQSGIPGLGESENQPASSVDPATLSIYTNGVYGFSVLYPATAVIEDSFSDTSGFAWRTNASATGTLVVRIVMTGGEVRIGASGDARATQSCNDEGPSEREAEPLTVGSTTWSVFIFEELGTDLERRVTSYRTLQEGQCFAIETFVPILESEGTLPTESVDFVVRNFTFAR